jgi:hypothetical protein
VKDSERKTTSKRERMNIVQETQIFFQTALSVSNNNFCDGIRDLRAKDTQLGHLCMVVKMI